MMTELSVTVSKVINASIETVFDAWLDPEKLSAFILPKPGMPNPEVSNNPEVGGGFEIIMHVGENTIPHHGVYRVIDRPSKLEFTWNSPFSTKDSVVTLDFLELNDTRTEVTLTHVKFPSEESRNNHEGGWTNILEALNNI